MWILKKLTGETTIYLISGKNSYTVGRKNCDIKFENDTSTSRKHCTIYISNKNNCPFPINTLTGVWVVDEQSKYGTYLCKHGEWVKINPNQNEILTDGSIVRFGLVDNIFSLEYKPVVACFSGISIEQKKEIENSLKLIDGELCNGWRRDCSLVIVREISLTVKVVLALINGIPIVIPQYIQKLVDSIKNQTPLPQHQNFLPSIRESVLKASLVSLDPKDHRKELFKGKKFLISTKPQLDILKEIITSAGGMVELLSGTGSWERFVDENVIVIQPQSNETDEKIINRFKKISEFLKNANRRAVPESEIAQAVAYSSINKYCNPQCGAFCLRKTQRQIDPGSLLVDATPEVSMQAASRSCVIPSSSRYSFDNNGDNDLEEDFPDTPVAGKKRTRSPEKEEAECVKAKERRTENTKKADKTDKSKKASGKGNVSAKEPETPKSLFEKIKGASKLVPEKNSRVDVDDLNENVSSRHINNPNQPTYKPKPTGLDAPRRSKEFSSSNEDSDGSIELQTPSKRKLPSGSGSSSRKRSRILEETAQAEAVIPIREPVHAEVRAEEPPGRRIVAYEDDLETFIEKERTNGAKMIEELNDTIVSLQLVPALYLNADKSLVEPPSVLTNIKRFKKRGALVQVSTRLEEPEEEFSGGDWVEPHFADPRFAFAEEDGW